MGDDVISCSPQSNRSASFRNKRRKKFHQSESFNTSFVQSEASTSSRFQIQTSRNENIEDLFEEEYDLILAECVPPSPSKPRNIGSNLLSQGFLKAEDFIKKDSSSDDSKLNKTFTKEPADQVSVIDRILRDFEISPVKERKSSQRILRKYPASKKKLKPEESDCESSISWQEEALNSKSDQLDDISKSQIMFNKLLNLGNFFSEPLDLDCTQTACPEDISLALSFNFVEEEKDSVTVADEYVSLKFNDFYANVFDGSKRMRLFEDLPSDPSDIREEVPLDDEIKQSGENLSILCGNTEQLIELCKEEERHLEEKERESRHVEEEVKSKQYLSMLCGNTELFADICSPEFKSPFSEGMRKPTAKRKLSLHLAASPETSRKKCVRFDLEVIADLNGSKCNIEDELWFEGFEPEDGKKTDLEDSKRFQPSTSGLFQTAGKKAIQVSEESLKISSKMYEEVMKEEINLEDFNRPQPTFQTAGKKAIKVSEDSLKISSKMYEEVMKEDLNLENFERPKTTRIGQPSTSGLFRTAGKKAIKVTEESLKRSCKMYEEVMKEDINLEELDKEKRRFEKENIDNCAKTPKPNLDIKFSRAKSSPNLKAFCDNAATTSTPIPKKFGTKLTQEEVSESIAAFMEDTNSFDETSSSKNISVSDRISMLSKFDNPPPLSPITPVSGKTTKRLGLRRFASFQIATRR